MPLDVDEVREEFNRVWESSLQEKVRKLCYEAFLEGQQAVTQSLIRDIELVEAKRDTATVNQG